MKITQLEILPAPFQGRAYIYVKLYTDEGIIGIGEASCSGKRAHWWAHCGILKIH